MALTTDEAVKRLWNLYGDVYDYSKVSYVNYKTPLTLVCRKHGMFTKLVSSLFSGHGCPECTKERLRAQREEKKADYAARAEKRRQTLLAKYGVENVMQLDSTKEKQKETIRRKYGVDNVMQSRDVKAKAESTCIERYGAAAPLQSEEIYKKMRQTTKVRYGAENFMLSDAHFDRVEAMREAARATSMERYGATHWAKSDAAAAGLAARKAKENASKWKNDSFAASDPEDTVYDILVNLFGHDDVRREYMSDVYPSRCDFYILSRDLYIECNFIWTHGGHWFRGETEEQEMLEKWTRKDSKYYRNAVNTWIHIDVEKREAARRGHLNYVVFWMADLLDVDLWIGMGCPDGCDWEREYSWLPKRELVFDRESLSNDSAAMGMMLAKKYQFSVFYENELKLWRANDFYKGVPLQAYLYANRWKYIKKIPSELSGRELLRSFKIAGVFRSYTSFDSSLMEQVLSDFSDMNRIYDPFAGWGERMLCAARMGHEYFGRDINEKLKDGYEKMVADECLADVSFETADSRKHRIPFGFNTVITCPPYWNTEIYTEDGMENGTYAEFLDGWKSVVTNCSSVEYFCFQCNVKYTEDLCKIVEQAGFSLVRTYDYNTAKSSHFTRSEQRDRKREKESMYAYRRNH